MALAYRLLRDAAEFKNQQVAEALSFLPQIKGKDAKAPVSENRAARLPHRTTKQRVALTGMDPKANRD